MQGRKYAENAEDKQVGGHRTHSVLDSQLVCECSLGALTVGLYSQSVLRTGEFFSTAQVRPARRKHAGSHKMFIVLMSL